MPEPISVHLDTSIAAIARVLRQNQIHRVLVLDGEFVVGIISTFDLVALLEREHGA